MRRRELIAAGTAAALAAPAAARASETAAPEGAATLNVAGVGLPVVVEGRLRNYVFVSLKLTLGSGHSAEDMRGQEPRFRDALVRTAHRAPFSQDGDWTRLYEPAINAAMVAIADVIGGKGSVAACEVTMQTPRRRTGMPAAA